MKHINTYINEKLKISKPNKIVEHTLFPKSRGELVDIIKYQTKINGNECSLNHIDVSHIENMAYIFKKVNGDISQWDVSNVRAMTEMFERSDFNQPIGKLNPLKLTEATFMFSESKFNQDISRWDLFKCKTFSMFLHCKIKRGFKPIMNK